jgi:NAD(P)H-hydrate epimerase
MERAAQQIYLNIINRFPISENQFSIVVGPGNNGGDGLALARMLFKAGANVKVYSLINSNKISPDCQLNLDRFIEIVPNKIVNISNINDLDIGPNSIIIDCIFGTGLTRPTEGFFAAIISKINELDNFVISIDIPSGLFGEDNTDNIGSIVCADLTLTLQFFPLSSMFSENGDYYGEIIVLPIGLNEMAIANARTNCYCSDLIYAKSVVKKRKRFDHKGIYGHGLLIAGSFGKAGAAILASKSCMRSGVGLLTTHVPIELYSIMQISVPEAMISTDKHTEYFTGIENVYQYNAVGIGPGIGMAPSTEVEVKRVISANNLPIVIDADALNILSKDKDFLDKLKSNTILTPHPKEFERLFGRLKNSYQRMIFMQSISIKHGIIIILKGGITSISLPNGDIVFNTFGNPGMATGGSGDVLTGIILSLLSQNYEACTAAVLGVYIHSTAGDLAKKNEGEISLIASDIINNIPDAFENIV